MPQVPLTHCPECGYSLNGLPPRYRCPECAFEYNEHTRVWKPARPWRAYVSFLVLTILVLKGTSKSIAAVVWYTPTPSEVAHFVFAGAVLIVGGLAVVRLIRATRGRRYVAVTPTGVRARFIGGTVDVPWSRVRGARVKDAGVELLFIRPDEAGTRDWCYVDDMGHGALKARKDGLAFCEFLEAELNRRDAGQQSRAI